MISTDELARVTWLQILPDEDGLPVVLGRAGADTLVAIRVTTKRKEDLREVLNLFPNANNCLIGEKTFKYKPYSYIMKDYPWVKKPAKQKVDGYARLRLTKTDQKCKFGCFLLKLEYLKGNTVVDYIYTTSGIRSRQNFRKGKDSVAGTLEPLPEGLWYINDILWAKARDRYGPEVFRGSIGPVTIPISYVAPGTTRRSAIEIHLDWNRHNGAPGTAGCIGVLKTDDMKKLVGWLRDSDPRDLYVDYGLGSCPEEKLR